ncbi:MAG: hypothetical protein NC912_05195 [Candidatus Omnitrophica bacterium]|nr:hypothetical protein [Candidatus Omnitrophota bacterium]
MSKKLILGIIIFLTFNIINIGKAQEETKIIVLQKTVNGEVGGIGPNFIAVTYEVDENAAYEIAFDLDKEVRFRNKKGLNEINLGDMVSVRYEETIEEGKQTRRVLKRKVKEIVFLKSAPKESETSALRSEPTQKGR